MRLLLVLVAFFGGAVAQTFTPNDFARGFYVKPAADGPVQALELPLEVYRLAQQPALADLRVFDAQGLEVAHTVLNVQKPAQAPRRVAVPFFRLGSATLPADLELSFSQPSGTTLELRSSEPGVPGERGPYLLDARAIGGSVAGLSLNWGETGPFVTTLTVETSPDLERWSRAAVVTVAWLADGPSSEVALPQTAAAYLRLNTAENEPLPPLRAVVATVAASAIPPARRWLRLSPTEQVTGRYTFFADARLSVDRARLGLPKQNTLLELEVFSAAGEDVPAGGVAGDTISGLDERVWTPRFGGLAYRLAGRAPNPPFRFSPTTDRLWQVRVAAAGGGLGDEVPTLELGYEPQTLVFLSRGGGPYTVAYGSPTASPSAFDKNAFETVLAVDTVLQTLPRSRAGASFELAGAAALAPAAPFVWRRVVLWASLVAGVGVLEVVAFGLVRQLDTSAK